MADGGEEDAGEGNVGLADESLPTLLLPSCRKWAHFARAAGLIQVSTFVAPQFALTSPIGYWRSVKTSRPKNLAVGSDTS